MIIWFLSQVLCEWLQRIIMATPGQTDPTNAAPDIEGQVDKNAFLLHTIAAYMVKDNRLVHPNGDKLRSLDVQHKILPNNMYFLRNLWSNCFHSHVKYNHYLFHLAYGMPVSPHLFSFLLINMLFYSSSLIEKEVPKAILQSLITVATGVLHQTHNAQGFQELMLIMSTLAKAGGNM